MTPSLNEEKKLWKRGYKRVVCLDEAGRGPLAGPVVAGAVAVRPGFKAEESAFSRIKDSKKVSARKREYFYRLLIKHPAIEWGVGRVSEKIIDKINILEATKLAMIKAVRNLENKTSKVSVVCKERKPVIDFLILDGKMSLGLPVAQESIVKADEKVFSCAAASIVAKVTRDRIMIGYHKKYPKYRFDIHKGYPTKRHREMIKKYGSCPIHRTSFGCY